MHISYLIKDLKKKLDEHGDIQVTFYCHECGAEAQVDIVEFEAADARAVKTRPRIVLGE